MEKKKLPLEQDVDIEFEYKVYMFYDFVKKNIKLFIAGIVLIILLIVAFFYYRHHQQEILNKSSSIAYQISKLYQDKKYQEAEKLINKIKKEYPESPFVKVAIAYDLLIKKDQSKITPEDINKLQVRLNSQQLNAGLTEYKGYLYYKNKEYGKTLNIIKTIDQRFYNYISALTLKAFTLQKTGNSSEAKNVFNEILQLSKYDYFKLLAKENL